MNNPSLPDDVLVIHYLDLASHPATRLEVCRIIGQLLENSDQSLHLPDLNISLTVWKAVQKWLTRNEVQQFWRIEGQVIVANEPCTKHLLVGTRYLLADLSQININQPPELEQVAVLWQAAAQLLAGS